LLGYCEAVARVVEGSTAEIGFCYEKLGLPAEVLNPPPLITGDDLKQLGLPPGPAYRKLLDAVRDAQLDNKITTRDEALELARNLKFEI
ncbi:MAG: CCA tRNA nucleotidyltransferase, partial [Planctomycetia bacterium]|nr:CCA tRNA nucleotidyltransferase [Planctomycetia bacterium]